MNQWEKREKGGEREEGERGGSIQTYLKGDKANVSFLQKDFLSQNKSMLPYAQICPSQKMQEAMIALSFSLIFY